MTDINIEVAAALPALPFTRLTHFTPSLNLPNIVADGELRSVKALKDDVRACYRATDLQRLDGFPDKVCCSIQYPNGYYFDIARRRHDVINYPDWVCLLLDKGLVTTEGTLFSPRNAAAAGKRPVPGAAGLQACYAPSVPGQGGQMRTRGPRHDPRCPTDVQAEVLATAPVPLSAIHGVVFPTAAAAEEEYGRLDRFGTLPPDEVQWIISPSMFDKIAITNAVRFGHGFAEAVWPSPSQQVESS